MPTRPRRSPATVAIGFDPDPQHLLPPIGVQKGPAATQRFRVQRSRDLVNLQVVSAVVLPVLSSIGAFVTWERTVVLPDDAGAPGPAADWRPARCRGGRGAAAG